MDPHAAGQAAQEMGSVHTALQSSLRLVRGIDELRAALDRVDGPAPYSPLHTSVEQAIAAAERIQRLLRAAARKSTR